MNRFDQPQVVGEQRMTTARKAMFINHNKVGSPCRFNSSEHRLLLLTMPRLLRAFLSLNKSNAATTPRCTQWLQFQTPKATNQPLQAKELKTPLTKTLKSLQSGCFGLYQLTGEV